MLKLENVGKIYSTENNLSVGIRKVNLEFNLGEFVAITGESGSGKSTLLNVLSGIDSYEEGEMYVNGEETSYFSIDDLENYRDKYVGFIFQNYNIIDSYTVLENVETALLLIGETKENRKKKAVELIERVGLKSRINTKASKLSGGEKQRVVIARALAKDPLIIAADEPTGNLDSKSSKEIIDLLYEVSKDKLVLIVTHDFEEVEEYATRLIRVYDGEIKEDRILKETSTKEDTTIINTERKKIKLKDIFRLSLPDLFSSPKRAIFYLLVIFFMSLFCAGAIGVCRTENQSYYETSSSFFSNTDERRIVINKKDGTPISNDELNNLKNKKGVSLVVENDFILDESFYLYRSTDEYYFWFDLYPLPSSSLKESDIAAGRLPNAKNEVVISYSLNENPDDVNSLNDLIGEYESYRGEETKYKVVGVVDSSFLEKFKKNYIYLYDEDFSSYSIESYKGTYIDATLDFEYKEGTSKEQYKRVTIEKDSRLSDDEFSIEYFSECSKANIHIYDVYHDIFNESLNYKELLFDTYVSKNWYSSIIIYLSENNYNKCLEKMNERYQLSLFISNSNSANQERFRNDLENMGYRVVIPSVDGVNNNIVSSLISGGLLISISLYLLQTLLIVYIIFMISIKSRKDDIEILRTIGAKENDIKRMFTVEFTFVGAISYFLIVILYVVLLFVTKGTFLKTLKAITFIDFIILFVLIFLMNLALSHLFSKRMFKKTIKKSLDSK